MDPRLIKGLCVVGAIVLYVGAGYLPADFASHAREVAAMLIGWQALRRPGDLGPVTGRGDS